MFYETCSALEEGKDTTEPPKKKRKNGSSSSKVSPPSSNRPVGCKEDNYCGTCGNWGHKRRSSKLCPMNKKLTHVHPSLTALETMTDNERERTQQSLLDTIPLDTDNTEDYSSVVDNILRETNSNEEEE
ncbi:unknown protein [Seminavis robusta]|uniref:Zinc knuckle domain-containing protein n=1 Tax=Seminavis robusta TaxID=568900 RepID=A0A9N8F225_9STRA|nr:unknown protein [Seminavis robusta]|eukprot:Sro2640_g333400.1 n/a (129) ;mRNA; f:4564-4950